MTDKPHDESFEPEPDAWDRFERAFEKVVKSPVPATDHAGDPPPKRPRGRPRKNPA